MSYLEVIPFKLTGNSKKTLSRSIKLFHACEAGDNQDNNLDISTLHLHVRGKLNVFALNVFTQCCTLSYKVECCDAMLKVM